MRCILGHDPVPLWEPTYDAKCYRFGAWCRWCWKELPKEQLEPAIRGLTRWGVGPYHQSLLVDCISWRS